jgi:UDP-glucose 4-epimerase
MITGGAGFIGSHLTDKLMQLDNYVTVIDNLSGGRIEFIEHHLNNPNFKFIERDLLDLDEVKKNIKGNEIVFHLSANPDPRIGIQNTDFDLKQETIVTYNVLEAMRVNNIKKIVFASSGTIYGETPVIPLREDYGPALPISLYGAGKLGSEGLISAFCGIFNFQAWIYRFGNIIGSRATHGVIYDLISKLKKNPNELEILGDGKQERPYIYVKDCIEGILFGLEHSNEMINVLNLACESSTDVNKIAQMIVEELDFKNVKFLYTGGDRGWLGDVPQVRFNCEKINKLGWKTRYTSDESVRKAIKEIIKEIFDKSYIKEEEIIEKL